MKSDATDPVTSAPSVPTDAESAYREAEAIVARAKNEADAEASVIIERAQKEAAEIVAKAKATLETERRKTMIELSGTVVELAVDIASKIVGNELSRDAQLRLAKKYMEEVSAPDAAEA